MLFKILHRLKILFFLKIQELSLLALRKHQGWWQAFESKLRGELLSRGLEKMLWAHKRKER